MSRIDPVHQPPERPKPWLMSPGRWIATGLSVPLIAASAWAFSFPATAPGLFGAILLPLLLLPLWLAFAVYWVAVVWRSTRRLRSWRRPAFEQLWAPTLVLVCGVAIVLFGASLRVRFELSETELRSLARDPPPNRFGDDNRSAGLYTIKDIDRTAGGAVLLVTHECGLALCGFAYAPGRPPREICEVYNHTTFDHLVGDWFVFLFNSAKEDEDC